MKPPTTVKELKSFLGKLSYIRRFIPDLAALTAAFTPLLKKGRPYCWSQRCQQAFSQLQKLMTKLPTVYAPTSGKPPNVVTQKGGLAFHGIPNHLGKHMEMCL